MCPWVGHTAPAIPGVTIKGDLFVPSRHWERMSRNDGLENELSLIFCTESSLKFSFVGPNCLLSGC